VTFEGESSRTVQANEAGVYEVDLPVGIWTATLTVPGEGGRLSRPRHFRVTASSSVVLNLFLRPPVACNVAISTPDGRPATREEMDRRDAMCYREDYFQVPSADGAPFEVDLGCLRTHRQFATYNLLSVWADKVAYHPSDRILEASGNAVIQDESGEHKADSVAFKIQDGRAIQQDR
jgi:hypothetical protein